MKKSQSHRWNSEDKLGDLRNPADLSYDHIKKYTYSETPRGNNRQALSDISNLPPLKHRNPEVTFGVNRPPLCPDISFANSKAINASFDGLYKEKLEYSKLNIFSKRRQSHC